MRRNIIPNIPRIAYDGNETDFSVNLLAATFTLAGPAMDRAALSFYSGMANHFCWIEGNWLASRGCECFGNNNETPFEAELRLLNTLGWSAAHATVRRDKTGGIAPLELARITADIVASIDRGHPVLSRRLDNHRYNIIIGYEDDGGSILCKEAVDDPTHSDAGTFAHADWQATLLDYIILKEQLPPIPERQRVLGQLARITAHARSTVKIRGLISSGAAAWEAYLHMLQHEDLSALPLSHGRDSVSLRLGIYCDGLCQIYGRHAALPYYRALAIAFPEWRDALTAAADALDACAQYGGFLWTQGFAFEGPGLEKFRDPAARKILADEGRKAMQHDLDAIAQFESILRQSQDGRP